MTRDSESRLIGFCLEQHECFDAGAWPRFEAVTREELATVARYLGGVDWYGHRTELGEVAAKLSPRGFAELARDTEFDAPRFGGLLKAHLAHAGRMAAT